jgi:hypothetical protein
MVSKKEGGHWSAVMSAFGKIGQHYNRVTRKRKEGLCQHFLAQKGSVAGPLKRKSRRLVIESQLNARPQQPQLYSSATAATTAFGRPKIIY